MDAEGVAFGVLMFAVLGGLIGGVSGCVVNLNETKVQAKTINELTLKYESLQCNTRGLELTTVKGITLCMSKDTKALHKIDEKAN